MHVLKPAIFAMLLLSGSVWAEDAETQLSEQAENDIDSPILNTPLVSDKTVSSNDDDVVVLEEVTVSVGRREQLREEVAAPVNVIDRAELDRRQARSVGDVLRDIPGVTTSDDGPRRSAFEPTIRGLSDGRVVTRIDGARQNFLIDHRGQTFLDPSLLQRVEVLRGPASTLFGSGAIGGVVDFQLLSLLVTLPAWAGAAAIAIGLPEVQNFPDNLSRLWTWAGVYLSFLLLFVLLTLVVSALARSTWQSFALLAAIWLLSVLLLPRVSSEFAELRHPSPEAEQFWADIKKEQKKGIDSHNPNDSQLAELERKTLERYGVQASEELPISFTGIVLQAGEDFGNKVFDQFYTALWERYAAQLSEQLRWAWLAPAIAAQQLARQAAGTDVSHHRHFADAAETHRRKLQSYLNEDMTRTAKGKDFSYLAGPEVWAKAPQWSYQPPSIEEAASGGRAPWTVLLVWIVLLSLAIIVLARRLGQQGAHA